MPNTYIMRTYPNREQFVPNITSDTSKRGPCGNEEQADADAVAEISTPQLQMV
jgi:hypothetical protein